MAIFTKTYNNGLRLCLDKTDKNVIGVNILFFVGSRNEQKNEEGYSHFIEHLMFKSSENFSTEEIADKLTFYGADFNASTSRRVTRYNFKCLAENFEPCFEIYSDMILRPKYMTEEMDKERNVVIEEMKRCADDPVEVLYAKVMENYFDGDTFAHDELGTEDIISNVSREELLEYKNRFYKPENCVVSISGKIELETVEKAIERYFVFGSETERTPNLVKFETKTPTIKNKYDIVDRDDNQANVCVHIKSTNADGDKKYIAELYTSILGNSQNSRLYKTIREELGLVYSIYAFSDSRDNSGEIFIIFGTRPKNIELAMTEIKKIILDLAESGVSDAELERAKNLKKSSVEYLSETSSDRAEINATMMHYYNQIISVDEKKCKFDAVTKEDILKFAKQIANEENFNVVAVGKKLNIDHIKKF